MWRELIGAIIALMMRLLSEDKERDILAIHANPTQSLAFQNFSW